MFRRIRASRLACGSPAVLETALTAAHVNEAEREGRLRELAGRAGFEDLDAEAASLSGGWRKRLAIVEALVSRAGCAAAGRADQSPGPRRDRMAGGAVGRPLRSPS